MKLSLAPLAGGLGALVVWACVISAPADPADGAAAAVRTDFSCYLRSRAVRLSGTGFRPGARYTVSEDGTALGPGTVAADGTISGTLDSGRLPHGNTQIPRVINVSDGANQASIDFQVTTFSAGFSPTSGDPRNLMVRYSVYGFAPGAAASEPLYLHYLSPSGRGGQTIRIGSTHTPCGTVSRTRIRHLFPFRPRPGTWRMQFDTSSRYSASSQPRVVRSVVVR